MDWRDTPGQAAFREEVRQFVREQFPASYEPDSEQERSLEPEDVDGYNWAADRACSDPKRREGATRWAAALAERGWIAPQWPREYGGAGLGPVDELVLREELMRAGAPTVNGIGVFLLGPTLLRHGSEEQRREQLPKIARGERVWAQAFSEPSAGSDLAGLETRAARDGEYYVVNGQKVWTSLADCADWLFVLVRTDPGAVKKHRGITFLMMDARSPGITIRPIEDMRGAKPFTEVFFEDVRVPAAHRVGDENRGWYPAMTTLTFERASAGAAIKCEQRLAQLLAYLRSDGPEHARADWGSAVRHEIAQRHIEIHVLHNLVRHAVSKLAVGVTPEYEASINQLFGAELQQRLARTGMKTFGALGQLWQPREAPLNAAFTHLTLDSIAATFLAGTTEVQRNLIATRGLGLPRG